MKIKLAIILLLLSFSSFAVKSYQISMPIMPKSVLPIKQWHYYNYFISKYLFRNLVSIDNKGLLRGDIAKRWSVSKDGQKYTFELKKNVFYQGYQITAWDIEYSLKRYFHKSNKSSIKSYLLNAFGVRDNESKKIKFDELIKVNNSFSISLNLKKAYSPLLYVLSLPTFGIIPKTTKEGDYQFSVGGNVNGKFARDAKVDFKEGKLSIISKEESFIISKSDQVSNYDVVLGPSEEDIEGLDKEKYSIFSLNGLAINHLYFNCNKEYNLSAKQRRYLSFIIQGVFDNAKENYLLKRQKTFLPNGVMPRSYFKDYKVSDPTPVSFKRKIILKLRVEHFSKEIIDNLRKTLLEKKIDSEITLVAGKDYVKNLQGREYHLISGASVGVFPDPDGFLSILEKSNQYKFTNCSTESFMKDLSEYRNTNNIRERLKGYSKSFTNFESQDWIIQSFSINPIIATKLKKKASRYSYKFIPSLGDIVNED
ncbi:ABC transporter substrate-binding protein [Halobacteriovorax marinus]|uniref:ABC transporter substrate-binding protein n=1 Tax=Halobacteriovorax marinus TaxID=97084 RepID=UPI003A91D402